MQKHSNPESGLFHPRFLLAFFLCSAGVLLAPPSFAQSPNQPNLMPYQLQGWSDKIVVSNVSGTNTDTRLLPADTLYVDWAVLNGGSANINASFTVELYVDDVFRDFWTASPPTNIAGEVRVEDYNLGSLSNGTHTLRIKSNATNSVAESDEADNEYTKTITIGTNDNFVDRTVLTGSSGFMLGSNLGATKEAGEPLHAGNAGGASIWYSWTAPASYVVTFRTNPFPRIPGLPEFDTLLAVYTGNTVNSLDVIASNDDSSPGGGSGLSSVTFNAIAGVTYQIAIDGKNGATGRLELRWLGPGFLVTTTSSPSNGGTTSGDSALPFGFLHTVTATANSGFTFVNWTENGNVVSTLASYTFTVNNNRNLVANFNGPAPTPIITIASSPAVVNEGGSAAFTISASTVNPSQPVTVSYRMISKALNGVDYILSGLFGQITIPAGASSATVTLNVLTDNLKEKNEKVIMALQPGTGYELPKKKRARSANATVTIAR